MGLTTIDNAIDSIKRAIIDLQNPQPFFAYLVMNLKLKELPKESPTQTMGVDAKGNMYFAEKFVMEQVEKHNGREIMTGIICHEVLHIALLHLLRIGSRNKEISNIAQDMVVNSIVLKSGFQLPEDSIPYNHYTDSSNININNVPIEIKKVSKKTWEEIYSEIIQQLTQSGQPMPQLGNGKGRLLGFDEHIESEGLTPDEKQELAQKWQSNLAEAANYAKQRGKLPGGMSRIIDELLKPKVNWPQLLLKYLQPFLTPVDWTYQKPNKKSKVLGVYLPNVLKEHCEVEVIVDTSGSISKTELNEFLSEIVGIARSMQHITIGVTFVDAKIQNRYVVDNGDIPKILAMEPKGGGGTSMETGLDYIKEKFNSTPVTIVLTDGYTSFHRTKKDYPFEVIWVITKNGLSKESMNKDIPYGLKVRME